MNYHKEICKNIRGLSRNVSVLHLIQCGNCWKTEVSTESDMDTNLFVSNLIFKGWKMGTKKVYCSNCANKYLKKK